MWPARPCPEPALVWPLPAEWVDGRCLLAQRAPQDENSSSRGVPQLAAASNLFGWVVGALSVVLYSRLGQFDLALFGKVLVGLMPGLFAGALASRRIPRRWFVLALGLTGLYLGARLLLR